MTWIADAHLDALLADTSAGLRAALGEKLAGLYVFGSIAAGHYEHGVSDVDLIAALTSTLNPIDFDRVASLHAEIVQAHPEWRNRLEIAYIALNTMRRIQPDDEIALISPGEPFHFKSAGNDWFLNLFTLREHSITMFGPPPQTIVDPVTADELAVALKRLMLEWREWITQTELIHQSTYQGHMVITMCRSLYLFAHGRIASKREAAIWAARSLPDWSELIEDALRWREQPTAAGGVQDATLPRTLRFVRFVIDLIVDGDPPAATP
jgi:hypothetical protein